MVSESNRPIIGFRSAGSWTGSDLVRLAQSTTGIYNAFLATRVRDRLESDYFKALDFALRRYEKSMDHPFYHDLLHAWRHLIRDWHLRSSSALIPLIPVPIAFGCLDLSAALPTDEEIYLRLEEYTSSKEQLRVYRLRHASPGGFSFQGIGEIIEQMRELIKDLWWRNRAERSRDQLDLIDHYLRVRRENPEIDLPLPPFLRTDRYLAGAVEHHLVELKALEDQGKLDPVTEHLDYSPD